MGQIHDLVDYWQREQLAGPRPATGLKRLLVRAVSRAIFWPTWRLAYYEDNWRRPATPGPSASISRRPRNTGIVVWSKRRAGRPGQAASPVSRASVLIAIGVALVVLAVGRWVPLPPLITGEEAVRQELVDTRGKVVAQRYLYLEAQTEFEHYLYTVAVPAIPTQMHDLAAQIRSGANATTPTGITQSCAERVGPQATPIQQAQECARRAAEFGRVLSRYAHPADDLFTLLRQYDDQLMAYSRTLGARSEELRRGPGRFSPGCKAIRRRWATGSGSTSSPAAK